MSEKDTTNPPGYNPPIQPAMQIQQPAAAQLQPGMGYQSNSQGTIGNVAYLPQVPQGAIPQQFMQPQPTQGGTYPQPGTPCILPGSVYTSPGGAYPPPSGAFPQAGVVYSQPNNFTSQQPAPQQAVGAPRMYQTAMPIMALTQGAAPVDCPACGQRVVTRTEYQAGSTTHLWAIILGICFCLPCIPYLMDSSKDVKHSCGNCGVHLATWHRSGNTIVFQHS